MNHLPRFTLAGALLLAALPAHALQHFMKVREVYVGPADDPNAQYVNLQMYAPFQNQVQDHAVRVYDAAGEEIGTYTFTLLVPNFMDQAYILIATAEAEARFGVTADLRMTPDMVPAGGKVCFEAFDCFAWGDYAGSPDAPDKTGTPFEREDGLPPGSAVRRDISAGDPALLEDADDTGDSAADFAIAEAPQPTSNLALGLPAGPAAPAAGSAAPKGGTAGGGALALGWVLALAVAYRRRRAG